MSPLKSGGEINDDLVDYAAMNNKRASFDGRNSSQGYHNIDPKVDREWGKQLKRRVSK